MSQTEATNLTMVLFDLRQIILLVYSS